MLYAILIFIALAISLILLWPIRREKKPAAWLLLFMLASSFAIYFMVGRPEIIPLMKERNQRLAELRIKIKEDSEQVKRDASDTAAWIRLGAAFMETGQYKAAANSFKQAVLLTDGAPDVIMAYAKATIASEDGKVSDHAKKSLEMVLLQKPEHQEARYWLIVRRVQDGEGEGAMKDMQSLYRSLADESALRAMIDRQIGRSPPNGGIQ